MVIESTKEKRSLEQVLALFFGCLLLVLLIGSFAINIHNMRSYLEQQLQTHAQDAATSLGLSLSTVVDARDKVLAERMIAAIFDSGDYQRIVYLDLKGDAILRFESDAPPQSVPHWFIAAIPLEAPAQSAQVMSGWEQLGSLEVQSHVGYAYVELWQLARNQLGLYLLAALVGLAVMHAMLKFVLRPLQRMEQQAHAMALRQFDQRAPIPSTRELARVAIAMNEMADTLGTVFSAQLAQIESLREQSILDSLTGLHNREGFDRRLRAELESQDRVTQGSLILLQLHDFGSVNRQLGRDEADNLLCAVGREIARISKSHGGAFAARRGGADFSLFLPGITGDAADDLVSALLARVCGLQQIKQCLRDDLVFIGLAGVMAQDDASSLLSKADTALTQAAGRDSSGWQRFAQSEAAGVLENVRQASEWHTALQQVLASKAVTLHVQPVFQVADQTLLYHQVLARIELDGELLVAGVFLPMAERFQLMVQFDQLIVEKALLLLDSDSAVNRLGVSLSEQAVADEAFHDWIEARLRARNDLTQKLVFQVPEHVVNLQEDCLVRLCDLAKRLGFDVLVERFGVAAVPFSYLQRVNLQAIKIDHSFVRDIHKQPDNQFFVRTAAQIAHSQRIQLIAVGIESQEELDALAALGIDGAMGYHLGRPESP